MQELDKIHGLLSLIYLIACLFKLNAEHISAKEQELGACYNLENERLHDKIELGVGSNLG